MTVQTLKSRQQVDDARAQLRRRGLDATTSLFHNVGHRLGLKRAARVGDRNKSWDVLKTVEFLEKHVERTAPILDLGAYASEILPILHRLDFSDLTGIDLDPRIAGMPHATDIRYLEGDFLRSDLPSASCAAITAISVIEHGFDAEALLREIDRLLRPGGFFIASIDFWPQKIDTTGVELFGLDWCIFSAAEVERLIADAGERGLRPIGELDLAAPRPAIRWSGRSYTFAWMVLEKTEGDGAAGDATS